MENDLTIENLTEHWFEFDTYKIIYNAEEDVWSLEQEGIDTIILEDDDTFFPEEGIEIDQELLTKEDFEEIKSALEV